MGVSLSPHKGTAAKTRSRLRRQLRGRKKIFGMKAMLSKAKLSMSELWFRQ